MRFQARVVTTVLLLSLVASVLALPASADPTSGQSCSFPVTATDATGTEVTIHEAPGRVVTLAPSAAQTMWEIGAREKVVGLTKHASYLEGAASRSRVSRDEQLVSVEAVVDLRPDLVLAPHVVSNETVEKLREAGVTVYYFHQAETIGDVYAKTRLIGRLTGECGGAEETAAWMRERIGVVRDAVEGRDRPDVLYLFFGYTAGHDTFIHEMIEIAGGNNIAADANVTGYRQLSPEVIVEEDPDWIVRNSENPPGISPDVYDQTTAGRENRTVVVQIEHVNQAAPRIVHAITALAKHFHPEAYAAANATSLQTNTPTPTPSPAPETSAGPATVTSPTETPGQSGFGVLAVVTGLSIALVLSRRR